MGSTIHSGTHGDIGHADDLHARLLTGFSEADAVTLDISALESVDLSFVQLIEAARRHAVAEGKQFSLSSPASGPLATLIDDAGLFRGQAPQDMDFWFKGDAGK